MSLNQKKIRFPNIVLPLLLSGVAGHGTMALAQSAGTFIATGSMTTPRADHTATLLPNGKVLIAGGNQSVLPSSVLASAELYDSSTRTFTATGNMTMARARHSATLLSDGRVLICGGTGDLSAEIYDPATETFTTTGDMIALPYSWPSCDLAPRWPSLYRITANGPAL